MLYGNYCCWIKKRICERCLVHLIIFIWDKIFSDHRIKFASWSTLITFARGCESLANGERGTVKFANRWFKAVRFAFSLHQSSRNSWSEFARSFDADGTGSRKVSSGSSVSTLSTKIKIVARFYGARSRAFTVARERILIDALPLGSQPLFAPPASSERHARFYFLLQTSRKSKGRRKADNVEGASSSFPL